MSTPTLAQARSHYNRQRQIVQAGVLAVRSLFRRRRPIAEVVNTVAAYQYASATASVATMAQWAGADAHLTIPEVFAGVSSYGFPVSEPIIATIDRYVAAPVEPLPDVWWNDARSFMAEVEQLIASEIADAGRTASQVEFVTRPDWQNYVRMLNPPSCPRCAILAGRIYRDLEAFARHPNCFPAGTVVSGPTAHGASRRWYEGELVVIRTAGGKEVSATANHPVLTDQGWVPASLLAEGGYVVSRASGDRSSALLVPNHDQMPARIEDLWSADSMSPLGRVPVSAQDFHGDGLGSSHVDVVLADSLLGDREQVALLQKLSQESLALGAVPAIALAHSGACHQFGRGSLAPTARGVSGGSLSLALAGLQLARSQQAGLTRPANIHIRFIEASPDDFAGHVEAARQGVFTLSREIGGDDLLRVDIAPTAPRWDAPAGEFTAENRAGYADRGADLRERLAGQVELDRIVELRRVSFQGHVYNLTSSEGWYDANGLIVSNCDCVMIPVQNWEAAHDEGYASSFMEAFDAGNVRGLSEADAQAIRDGADPARIVNATRGTGVPGITNAYATDLFGRRVKATRDATTKRSAWRRANPTRLVRLRPESIYKYADSREDAIRLLRLYGYLPNLPVSR